MLVALSVVLFVLPVSEEAIPSATLCALLMGQHWTVCLGARSSQRACARESRGNA